MSRSQLDAYGEGEPIWGFVAQMGADRFTGKASVGSGPRLHLYATDGHVYFAERDGDASLGSRFVSMGVLTQEQLDAGAVRLGDEVSLARLFSREPTVDRDSVELALEMMTAQTLQAAAMAPAGAVELFPLRHHASGIHQWKQRAALEPAAADAVRDSARVAAVPPSASPVTRSVPQVSKVEIADPSTLPTLGAWSPPSVEERLKTAEHRYEPAPTISAANLPKLATRPMSVNEIAAAQAAPPVVAAAEPAPTPGEDLASLVQRITDDDLADPVPSIEQEAAFAPAAIAAAALATPAPQVTPPIAAAAHDAEPVLVNAGAVADDAPNRDLPAATAAPVPPSVFANLPPLTREPPSTLVTSTFAQIVKTPPSNPTVEQGMDLEALFAAPPAPPRPAHEVPFSTSSWEPPVSPQATAEEIWGLVDGMVGAEQHDESLLASGAAGEKKPRGWRRSKKAERT